MAALAAASFGSTLVSMYRGNDGFASLTLVITIVLAIGTLIVFLFTREDAEAPRATEPETTPARRESVTRPVPVYTTDYTYNPQPSFLEGVSKGAGTAAKAVGEVGASAIHGLGEVYKRNSQFFLGSVFTVIAVVCLFTGLAYESGAMYHYGGFFALVAGAYFINSYQLWGGFWQLVKENPWWTLLGVSVMGVLVTLCHSRWPWFPLLSGFAFGATVAIISLLEGWGTVKAKGQRWLFQEGWFSLAIWFALAACGLFTALVAGNWRGQRSEFISFGILMTLSVIGTVVALVVAFWNKKPASA